MPNSSATGGFLLPQASPGVLNDELLQNVLHIWVKGLTGLTDEFVRPRWQPESPNMPAECIDWCAFGIISRENDTYSSEVHFPTGDGYDEIRRHQLLHCMASFYGSNADYYAMVLHEGMQINQNREFLVVNEIDLVESGQPLTAPEFVKERWLYRVDLPFTLRRRILLRYPILNLLSGDVTVHNEHYDESVLITNQ